jgi:uncharacterized protein YcfL
VKLPTLLLSALFLGACSAPEDVLEVKQFVLRDQIRDTGEEPMIRMEKTRRLHGAVSMEQRRQRLGQYYTLIWRDHKGVGTGEVEVVFQYQQGASASRIKRMTRRFPSSDGEGRAEFAIIGDDYFENGKVLAWKATVSRAGRELASRKSYLWE